MREEVTLHTRQGAQPGIKAGGRGGGRPAGVSTPFGNSRAPASPIKIAGTGRDKPQSRAMAFSAPTPSTEIPKAPSSRPKVPQRDPPAMMLPPSPPVFAPGPGPAANTQPRFVSDWTSVFSSSCPNTMYVDLLASNKQFSLTPLHETDEPEERSTDLTKLSQSPTIFSLLQRSLPTHTGVPFRGSEKPFVPSSRGASAAPAETEMEKKREPTPPEEDIMFPMSMDGETDTVLADATQSYLSFDH